jgi:capsular polysaccharide biosynthesis protein
MIMRTFLERFLYRKSHDSLVRVLLSWRLWVLGAAIGALAATTVYMLFPPPYRARAVVVIDHNLESVWEFAPAQNFYFLGRESRKLEELAWSDKTLGPVAKEFMGLSVSDLRNEILSLSHPADGGWQLWADHGDPALAEAIAGKWAEVFVDQIYAGMDTSLELELARMEVNEVLLKHQDMNPDEIQELINRMSVELDETSGISPWLEVYLAQGSGLAVTRSVLLSIYVLAGSVIGAMGLAGLTLFFIRSEEYDEYLAAA